MATYNLINSVKGGCGKTTFSIWLAYYLNNSLLIDMDLLGTSMQITFLGNTENHVTAYTNDIFHDVKNNKNEFIQRINLGATDHNDGKRVNVIFSSMDCREKDKFKSGKHSGYSPVVKHSIFRLGLKELIQANSTIDGEAVEHFIFDMPPNSDGFSDAAMECILNPKYSHLKKEDKKNLFIMIGTDWGQTIATINELESLLLHSDAKEPDRIFLVLNHNLSVKLTDMHYQVRKNKIETALNGWSLTDKIKNKIFFLKLPYNEHYTDLLIGLDGKALAEVETNMIKDTFLDTVISSVAKYGEEFDNIGHDANDKTKLLELILGE